MALAPRLKPMSDIGRTPACLLMRTSARTWPACQDRSRALDQGLSMRYPNFVKTERARISTLSKMQTQNVLRGHCNALIRAVMAVACSTVCPTWVKTSDVRIFKAFPISFIISGSHRTEKTSPIVGSRVENGSRTSSTGLAMNLSRSFSADFAVTMFVERTRAR